MQNSGKLVIGTKIDTNGFEKDLDKLVDITEDAGDDAGTSFAEGFTDGAKEGSDKVGDLLATGLAKATGSSKGLLTAIKGVVAAGGKAALILGGIAAVVGIVMGAVMLISKAIERLKTNNKQFITDIQYITWAIEQAMAPALDWIGNIIVKIVHLIMKAIKYAAALIKLLTGYNIFDNASAQKFADHLKNAEDSAGGISSNLKDAKKQLAGFDEMNVLNDTSGGGGGVGLANEDFTLPTEDFSDLSEEMENIVGFWEQIKAGYKETKRLVEEVPMEEYIKEYGLYGIAVKGLLRIIYGFWEKIDGQIKMAQGVWDVIVGIFTGDENKLKQGLEKYKEGFLMWLDGLKNTVLGIIEVHLGAFLGSFESFWNLIKKPFENAYNWVVDNFIDPVKEEIETKYSPLVEFVSQIIENIKIILGNLYTVILNIIDTVWTNIKVVIEDIKIIIDWLVKQAQTIIQPFVDWITKHIINPIVTKFNDIKQKIIDGIENIKSKAASIFNNIKEDMEKKVQKIVNLFSSIGQKVGDAIGGALKNAINGILGGVESILNKPIRAINGFIDKIRDIPGLGGLKKLSTFSFPRLAKGGIVNNPGPGVMMGSYIAGERGPEAVIPLDDATLDRLGLAFARHTNINATIPVYVGNRQVVREIKRIEAENNFAFNS